ncbi:hypothetical protein PsorP6_012242 [Peronosclerospora sorghi]|uniref:Uncharacterized protein n=1 Tax=Peronosclerospora sorghi TaxID=230839 RepID=A0ACC0WHC9_9STRA|nr:hypothetical protein PsorP6_012242 [Peronosclerospora sorghi]
MANNDVENREDKNHDSNRSRTKLFPQLGYEVRFRVAKHCKAGVKRATDLSITLSAREKIEKEIEAKLATMTRENGVVNRVKNGGGFIKCFDRPIDIYLPFHEVLESKQSYGQEVESGDTSQRFRAGKGTLIREGGGKKRESNASYEFESSDEGETIVTPELKEQEEELKFVVNENA